MSSVNSVSSVPSYTTQQTSAPTNKHNVKEGYVSPLDQDSYTPSEASKTGAKSGIYTKDSATIHKLWDEANAATETLRNIVSTMLGNGKVGQGTGQTFWATQANPAQYQMDINDETVAEAKAMIADDGYYGVNQTTGRIMDFAKALAGDKADEKTIANLRDGAMKAFDDVAKLFGGFDKLPDVTKKTYDAVKAAFDQWQSGVKTAADATAE